MTLHAVKDKCPIKADVLYYLCKEQGINHLRKGFTL